MSVNLTLKCGHVEMFVHALSVQFLDRSPAVGACCFTASKSCDQYQLTSSSGCKAAQGPQRPSSNSPSFYFSRQPSSLRLSENRQEKILTDGRPLTETLPVFVWGCGVDQGGPDLSLHPDISNGLLFVLESDSSPF